MTCQEDGIIWREGFLVEFVAWHGFEGLLEMDGFLGAVRHLLALLMSHS